VKEVTLKNYKHNESNENRIQSIDGQIKKKWKSCLLLRFFSKPLIPKVIEYDQKISISNFQNGLLIRPNGPFHITVFRNKGLQIGITKLIRKGLISVDNSKGTIPIFVDLDEWKINSFIEKSRKTPFISNKDIPNNLVSLPAAITKKQKTFTVTFICKMLSEMCRKEEIRCLFCRDTEGFVIVKSRETRARKLTGFSKNRVQFSIPKSILIDEEIKKFEEKSAIPTKIKFNLTSFDIKISDFFFIKEEKELVKVLEERNISILTKNRLAPFDIEFKNKKIAIEIHNSIGSKDKINGIHSGRHSIKIGQIRLRVLEAMHFLEKINLEHVFVIINQVWTQNKHIMNLVDDVKNKNVHVLFTDFKGNWASKVVDEISKRIEVESFG